MAVVCAPPMRKHDLPAPVAQAWDRLTGSGRHQPACRYGGTDLRAGDIHRAAAVRSQAEPVTGGSRQPAALPCAAASSARGEACASASRSRGVQQRSRRPPAPAARRRASRSCASRGPHLGRHLRQIGRDAACPQLQPAAPAARLGAGGDEQLHRRVRERSPCRCRARPAPRRGPRPKPRWKSSSAARTAGIDGHRGRRRVRRRPAQVGARQIRRRQRPRRRRGRGRIGRIAARIQHAPADRAVQQAGVEMRQAEMRGEPPRQRALAGRGRPVDGDDQARAVTPSTRRAERRSSARRNPGKLVSMKLASSTATGCAGRQAQHQRAHRQPVVHVGRDQAAARRRARRCRARSGRRPRSPPRTPLAASSAAVAASRSLSFTRSSFRPRIRVVPSRAGGSHRQDRVFVDHARRPLRRHVDAAQRAVAAPPGRRPARRPRSARSPPRASAPISRSVANSPVRSGLSPTPVDAQARARHQQRRHDRERRRGRIARHHHVGARAVPAGRAGVITRPAPAGSTATSAPKWRSMFSLWSRVASGSSTRVMPGAFRPHSSTRRLHLRRGHRQRGSRAAAHRARPRSPAAAGRRRGR